MAAGTIHVTSINYANPTGVEQTWRFQYKLATAPESSYVTFGTSTVQAANGNLNIPAIQAGLPSNTLYHVRAINLTCSPSEIFIQEYTTQ